MAAKQVRLADGSEVEFDRLLIATGYRARPWPNEAEAALDGVFVLRTRDDAAALSERLAGAAPGAGHRRRLHRLGDRLGLPGPGYRGHRRRTGAAPLAGRSAR